MEEKKFDWTYFRRRMYINNCSKEDIFLKWATPKGLTEWFIEEADYEYEDKKHRNPDEIVQANDRYRWKFHRGSVVTGTVLKVEENKIFRFTFGKKEINSNEDVIVTVTIHEKNGKCYFDILQENMAASQYGKVNYYISCNMGWMFHMYNLKSIIENGNDLRVKGEKRMHVDAPSGYPLEEYKWTEFTQKEYIKAPIEKVFTKWITSNNITKWFIAEATYTYDDNKIRGKNEKINSGDKYKWKFHQGLTMEGTIIDIKENQYLSFTFGKKEPGSKEDVIVQVFFSTDDKKRTEIKLFQSNIADSEYGQVNYNLSCIVGWCFFLTNLRSLFESGFDLRDEDQEIAAKSKAYTLEK